MRCVRSYSGWIFSLLALGIFSMAISPILAIEAARVSGTVEDAGGNVLAGEILVLVPAKDNPAAPIEMKINKKGKFIAPKVAAGAWYPKMKDRSFRIVQMDFEAREPSRRKVGEFSETLEPGDPIPTFNATTLMRYTVNLVVKKAAPGEIPDESTIASAKGNSPILKRLNELFEAEDWPTLLVEADQALEGNPDLGGAYYLRGIALWRTGKTAEAVESMREAAELLEGQEGLLGTLGTIVLENGRKLQAEGKEEEAKAAFREAEELFAEQLDEDPDSKVFLTNRVVALEALGDIPATLEALDELIEMDPDNSSYLMRRAELLVDSDRPEEAMEILTSLPEGGKKAAAVLFNAALEMYNKKKTEQTLKTLETVLELDPELAPAWQLKGRALISRGETAAGVEALKKYLSMVPEDEPGSETDRRLVEAMGGSAP